jgi:hypothetical protein
MTDNSTLPVAVGTEIFANKDIGGVKHPKIIAHDSTGAEILGTKTDAKSASTDATALTFMQVFKQISASVQFLVTAIGTTLWDLGPGTGGSRTQRFILDSAQLSSVQVSPQVMAAGFSMVDVPTDGTTAVRLGGLTDTAPATDTASSSLNGRLQRIAQRITSLIALFPTGLGAGVKAGALLTTVATDQATLAVAHDTSQLFNGASGVSLTPLTAKVNISSASTTTVIALVGGKKIRILAVYLVVGAANNVNWQSHATTSNGDSTLNLSANSGLVLNYNPLGWFDTTSGEALDIVTSTSAQLSGRIVYVAV